MSDSHKTAVTVIDRTDVAPAMSPVVAAGMAILQQSPSPETLRALLDVQREWERGEARKAFTRALVDLKRDLPAIIAKDATVDFTSAKGRTHYRHATLAGVLDAVVEPMSRHGFSHSWIPSTGPGGVTVICRLTHSAGHYEETTISAPLDDSGGKNKVQGVGSTITYLQRYTLLAILGVATGDMPEPTGEPPPAPADSIDTARNLRAVEAIRKAGRTIEAAQALVGRRVPEWTTADLDKLRAWLAPAPQEEPAHEAATGEVAPAASPLDDVLSAIAAARSQAELDAVKLHAAKLSASVKPRATQAWKARRAELAKPPTDEPPPDMDFGPPPLSDDEARAMEEGR